MIHPSLELWKSLAEEIFFFQYHMRLDMERTMRLPLLMRRWLIDRFIEQKESENSAMEASRRKQQSQSKRR